jgi:hypothetical protein
MSFSFSFAARTTSEARSKLHAAYAPGVVKALVEKALDAIPNQAAIGRAETDGSAQKAQQGAVSQAVSTPKPKETLIGVFVEVWGHLADAGDMCTSEIQRFIVKPLFG